MKKTRINNYIVIGITFLTLGLNTVLAEIQDIPNKPVQTRSLPNNFKEAYRGSEYDYVEHTSFIDRFQAWLFSKFMEWFNVNGENTTSIFRNIKQVFYFLVILFAIYIIIKLIMNDEIRWIFGKKKEQSSAIEFGIEENIQQADFKTLISNAESKNNYRLAIKYYFLFVLKKLDDKNLINYDPQKTAHDYQLELEETTYTSEFNKVAYYYTYIWYGEFEIDDKEYATTSTVYVQLLKHLGHE